MGKKKQPFIDRKNSSTYHVVRRSQRDVGTEATAETLSDFVLMPSPANNSTNNTNPNHYNNDSSSKRMEEEEEDEEEPSSSLLTSQTNKTKNKRRMDFQTLKSHIAAAGLLDETAKTYSQYTKPIDPQHSSGKFVPSTTTADDVSSNLHTLLTDTSKNTLDYALQEAMAVHEVGRMFDSIALTSDCMEEDMAQALFDFEEGQFEEILDDFCVTANMEELEEEENSTNNAVIDNNDNNRNNGKSSRRGTTITTTQEFNFEQHIQKLMEKARAQESGRDVSGRELEDDFFHGVTPLHRRIEEEEEEDEFDYDRYDEQDEEGIIHDDDYDEEDSFGRLNENNNEEQRTLCQKFEEALLEYDSDDVGNLDEECDDIVGDRPLEGDVQLEAALDEFLTEKDDEILIQGTRRMKLRSGGSGYSALIGKTMVNASDLNREFDGNNYNSLLINIEESKKQMARDLADADAILANPEMDLPPEEILIDGKSYFTVTSRSMWDCESILSTYSNLDNNPVVIGRSKKKKKAKKKNALENNNDCIPEDKPAKILLSNKTGLPLGVLGNNRHQSTEEEHAYDGEDTFVSINRGEARKKDESKVDKKERKESVKEERRICRMQKKIMRDAFKEEFLRRGQDAIVDPLGGNAVFRIS